MKMFATTDNDKAVLEYISLFHLDLVSGLVDYLRRTTNSHLQTKYVSILLGLVHTSDGSNGSGVVSGVGIGRKLWPSVNRHDGSGSGIGRKRNSSDPSDSDSIELPTPLTIPIFDLRWIVTLLALPIPTPLPIPSLVWTSPYVISEFNSTKSRLLRFCLLRYLIWLLILDGHSNILKIRVFFCIFFSSIT